MEEEITIGVLGDHLAWAAYMTHCLLDDVDLDLSPEDRTRLSLEARGYEMLGVRAIKLAKKEAEG